MKLITCFLGTTAFLSTAVFGALGKTTLWGAGISPLIDPSLWAHTQSPSVTWTNWIAYQFIPQRCYQEAQYSGFNPVDVIAFSVSYSDCSTHQWTFCWHVSAPLSQSDMVDLFGRLPVHERQWVQHVMAVPGQGSAYERSAVIVFRGAVGVPSVFQHETTHALDAYSNPTVGQFSSNFFWLTALAGDTCVPDSYANTNEAEDFAQIGVLGLFAAVNPGGMDPAFGSTWHCLLNQFNYWNAAMANIYQPGGTCTRSWGDSPAVNKLTGVLNSRSEEDISKRDGGQPPLHFSGITTYNVSSLYVDNGARAAAKVKQTSWAKEAAQNTKLTKRSARFVKL